MGTVLLRWGVLFVLLAVVVPPAWGDLTVAAYRVRVRRASELARQATVAPEREAVALVRQAQAVFPARARVRAADGAAVTVANRLAAERLAEALAARRPDARDDALERFRRGAGSLVALLEPGPAPRAPGELKTLTALLEQPPFAPSAFEKWDREIRERWNNWWREFARRFLGNPDPRRMERIARGVYWTVLALLVALLAYLIWTYAPGLRLPKRARTAEPDDGDTILAPERARARLALAEAAAAEGRYLEALRQTYAAMLLMLDEARLLAYDPARTNREVLRALRATEHAPVREVLTPVTWTVDERLYGGRLATAADYERARAACTRLMGLLTP